MHNYKKLLVWQEAVQLVIEIYNLTDKFPDKERFNLISQINRAAVSIPSNIAEGAGRSSSKDFSNFLSIANGSCFEIENQLFISFKLNYISDPELALIADKIDHIQKMIYKLKESLAKDI